MNNQTANILNQTTTAFYAAQAQSFSATRQAGWPGWQRVLAKSGLCSGRILDVACGNKRFEAYVQQELPGCAFAYSGVDSCAALAGDVEQHDIVTELLDGSFDLGVRHADLTVCFGFFHHVPGVAPRQRLLRALCEATRPGGLVAASFWRFMESPDLAEKARASHARALQHFAGQGVTLDLDEGDYLLGWQDQQEHFRYAHHFESDQVTALISSVADCAALEDRFFADGRTGALNEYVILRTL